MHPQRGQGSLRVILSRVQVQPLTLHSSQCAEILRALAGTCVEGETAMAAEREQHYPG